MNDMHYTYQTVDMVKVPGHRNTDPAMWDLFGAVHVRKEREENYNGNLLKDEQKEGYLDSIREELYLRSRSLKYQIYEIGRLLCEAKKHLEHGEFKPWVEEHFEHGYRTAYNCIRPTSCYS